MGYFLDHHTTTPQPIGFGCLVTTLAMIVGTFLCIGSLALAIDGSCVRDANRWLVDYPDSEVVTEDYNFLRPFGLGETTRILYTPDPVRDVRLWYNRHNTELSAQGYNRSSGQARMIWRANADPERNGTRIFLYVDCANTAFFGG